MWCLAPEWPEHARHVAVEFVHPVIMGKRALPAVAVDDHDPVSALRAVARPGDILCAVATASAAGVAEAMRARACGGSPRCGSVRANARTRASPTTCSGWTAGGRHADGTAAYDGSLVLRYHVLWELTHVCFEHPGLLAPDDAAACDVDATCITCSDEGTLAEVVTVDVTGAASVRTAGGVERIDVNLVGPVGPGDLVLVHAGAAIALVESETPMSEGTDFLYPFIEGDERDADALLRDLAASAEGKGAVSVALQVATLDREASSTRRRGASDGRSGSRPVGGCSRSATVEAPPTPPRSRRCSHARRRESRSRRGVSPTTPPCSPRWPTTSGSSSCSRAS